MKDLVKYLFIAVFSFYCFELASIAGAAEFPKGAFTLTTPDGDVWVLDFKSDGKFAVTQNGEDAVQGKYKVSKTQIEFIDESGPLAEPQAKEGTYQWKYEDDKLTFDKINDNADGRSSTLTAGPWDKKEK